MITLEKFITDLQRERAEVAFYIFTNGSQTLEMNLTTRNQDFIFSTSICICVTLNKLMFFRNGEFELVDDFLETFDP